MQNGCHRRPAPLRRLAGLVLLISLIVAGTVAGTVEGTAAPAQAATGFWPYLFVSNGVNTVTDVGPNVTTTLAVGQSPVDIAITPDGNYAYVSNWAAGTVSVIDNVEGLHPTVSSVALTVGAHPGQIAITPDGKYAYVLDGTAVDSSGAKTVSIIDGADTSSPSVSPTTLTVGDDPHSIAITPNGQYAYVADVTTGGLTVIGDVDSSTPAVVGSVPVDGANSVAITPDGQRAYVTSGPGVTVVNGVETASPTVSSTTYATGPTNIDLTVSPNGTNVFVVNQGMGKVSVINGAESATPTLASSSLAVGASPDAMAIAPDGSEAFVAVEGTSTLAEIAGADTTSPSVLPASMSTGLDVSDVAIAPVELFNSGAPQTITFQSTPPAIALVNGSNYTVSATASSGLPVTLSVEQSAPQVCLISGNSVDFTGNGTCTVDANQPGNNGFSPAPQVQQAITVRWGQAVTFSTTAPSAVAVGSAPYHPSATSNSGLPATISLDGSSTGCGLAGGVVTFTAPGTCVLDANQPGNSEYAPAPTVQQRIAITGLAITTTSLPTGVIGHSYRGVLSASGGSAPYTWKIQSGALPQGLSLNKTSGVISGTPSKRSATATATIEVLDTKARTAAARFTIKIT